MDELMMRAARQAEAQAQWAQVMRAQLAASILPPLFSWYMDGWADSPTVPVSELMPMARTAVALADAVIAALAEPKRSADVRVRPHEAAAE